MQRRISFCTLYTVFLSFIVLNAHAQNTFPSSGNVGIGTATPLKLLHVNGTGAFGNRVTNLNTTRALNIADTNAVLRILRVHNSFAPAVELIARTSANGPNLAYWDIYAEPGDASFRIRDRIGGAAGLDRITITSTGNIGIGTPTPTHRLDIVNSGVGAAINVNNTFQGAVDHTGATIYSVSGPGFGYGVQAYGGWRGIDASGVGGTYGGSVTGVYARATGATGKGYRVGVFGLAEEGANDYGVWGEASGGSTFNAAGYFNGEVWAGSYHTISDRRFKAEVSPLQNALEQVMKLRPASYQFKTTEFARLHLPKGRQMGLIADEVKQVFPELVDQAVHPPAYDEKTKEVIRPEVVYEGINYQGLIPVLIASVQELSRKNEELEARLLKLEALLTKGNNTNVNVSGAFLEQNTPNPARSTAITRYSIPNDAVTARLILTNAKGQVLKEINVANRGAGQVNLNTSELPAGVYHYTLWVDGGKTISKQLVIAR